MWTQIVSFNSWSTGTNSLKFRQSSYCCMYMCCVISNGLRNDFRRKKIICLQCTKPALMWSLFITKIRKDQDAVTFHMLYKSCIKRKAELLVWTYILQPLNTYGYDFASYLFIITVLRYVKRSFFYLHQMKKLSLYVLNHRKKSIHSK